MADGVDSAAEVFKQELTTDVPPPTRPRDQAGKFVETRGAPEEMFSPREIEGGDDAGPDTRRRSKEVEVSRANTRQTDRDDVHGAIDTGPERVGPSDTDDGELDADEVAAASDGGNREVAERRETEDDGQKYEVIIDGQPHEVTLGEALNGYVRQETFHRRLGELQNFKVALDEDYQRQQQNWAIMIQLKAEYEDDLRTMLPPEPDWDREFAVNPAGAHNTQKIYQALYGKLNQARQQRAQMAAISAQEADGRLQKYAVDGFSRFVFDSKIPDETTLKKEIQSMRKTAFASGFSEQEVATVYDHRMLSILRKASKYDRMMAATRPRAEVPGKGRTLTPGAATPLGNAPRKSFDDAQRRLASSGRLDDAVDVFRRML